MQCSILALLLLVAASAHAAPCPWVVDPGVSQKLYDRLQRLPGADCALADQTVDHSVVRQVWHKGAQSMQMTWTARACTAGEDGRLRPEPDARFAQTCPATLPLLHTLADAADFPEASRPVPRGKTQVLNADYDLVHVAEILELFALFGLLTWLAVSLRRVVTLPAALRSHEWPWWQAALATFALALALRFAVEPALSNWYTPTLGLSQVPKVDRYGAGHIALQALLRAALPWSDRVLFGANQVLGALIAPLWLVVLRQRALPLTTAALAAALLAVLPLHVRLSASASEHVPAAFFWIAALATWQAALQSAKPLKTLALGLLAAVLALLTTLTRVDAGAPLAAIALWTLFADRAEPRPLVSRRVLATLAWLIIVGLSLAFVFPLVHVAVVEQGTPAPDNAQRIQALRDFLPGMQRLLFGQPGWIGPIVGVALLAGVGVGLLQRPLLTVTALVTLLAIPIGIARSPYDFILMRYYLPALPVITLFAALALAPFAQRKLVLAAVLVAILWMGLPALRQHHTFQEEFAWLRGQLQTQPADCTVAQLGVSHRRVASLDVDCCLDLTRCPLVAALPGRAFALTDTVQELAATQGACRLYYEGAACALQPTDEILHRNPQELQWFQTQCAALRRMPGLTLVAETTLTPYSHTDAFAGKPVPVRLWRLP